LFERNFENIDGKNIAILGAAYRFNSEDTRNSPSLQLATQLQKRGCNVILHDPYVKTNDQNLLKFNLENIFTQDIEKAVQNADYIIVGTAHKMYLDEKDTILSRAGNLKGILDACNIYNSATFSKTHIKYTGIGRGLIVPDQSFIEFVYNSFCTVEKGLANEVKSICDFLNSHYAHDNFNTIKFSDVQKLAASCSTGCEIVSTDIISSIPAYQGFFSRLAEDAFEVNKMNPINAYPIET
jgi:hypothetical protein